MAKTCTTSKLIIKFGKLGIEKWAERIQPRSQRDYTRIIWMTNAVIVCPVVVVEPLGGWNSKARRRCDKTKTFEADKYIKASIIYIASMRTNQVLEEWTASKEVVHPFD